MVSKECTAGTCGCWSSSRGPAERCPREGGDQRPRGAPARVTAPQAQRHERVSRREQVIRGKERQLGPGGAGRLVLVTDRGSEEVLLELGVAPRPSEVGGGGPRHGEGGRACVRPG